VTTISSNVAKNNLVSRSPFSNREYNLRHPSIRRKSLIHQVTNPEIENEINNELNRLGYISDIDYEALELLMAAMDAGRIQVASNL
jgi:uncharacterized protein YjgD (DUF1641 family)